MRLRRTLFISDLHLDEARPAIVACFERFLAEVAPGADALYILGDLFEYWAGDDGLDLPFPARIARALAGAAREMPVHLMHGNRDFLIGGGFAKATGVHLLDDPAKIDLYGEPSLLMHGDTLCTDDAAYQAFRAEVRTAGWREAALARPLAERIAIAHRLRSGSEQAKGDKTPEIMDVASDAVERAFLECGCRLLIHGHTHRPGRHVHVVRGRDCVRWVLGDWYTRASYLEASPGAIRSVDLS